MNNQLPEKSSSGSSQQGLEPTFTKASGTACCLYIDLALQSVLFLSFQAWTESKMDKQKALHTLSQHSDWPFLPGIDPSIEAGFSSSHNGHHLGSRDCIWHQLVLSPNWSSTLAPLIATGFGSCQLLAVCLLLLITSISDLHCRHTRSTAFPVTSNLVLGQIDQLSASTVCPKDLVSSLSNRKSMNMLFPAPTAKITFHVELWIAWNPGNICSTSKAA